MCQYLWATLYTDIFHSLPAFFIPMEATFRIENFKLTYKRFETVQTGRNRCKNWSKECDFPVIAILANSMLVVLPTGKNDFRKRFSQSISIIEEKYTLVLDIRKSK